MAYTLIQLNGYWYVKSNTGKLLGAMLNHREATNLLKDLELVEKEAAE